MASSSARDGTVGKLYFFNPAKTYTAESWVSATSQNDPPITDLFLTGSRAAVNR
jgi:hypothetical protein